jgi:2-dehydro-3-deoxyphosphogluconate aldolase / (4S)-4-hydroxy-2-oxoglutarate aldolase
VTAWLSLLQQQRVIAVIRATTASIARESALAAAAGGIKLMEITWNTDNAESLIPKLQSELPDCKIGTGTILNLEMAKRAIASGCSFIFTPHTSVEIIELGCAANVPVIAGALTPTEILTAWQAGAAAVKVFPIKSVGGVSYLQCLRPVLGDIPLIPTGGVTVDNTSLFLQSGAIAVGISSDLFSPTAATEDDWTDVISKAQLLMQQVRPFQGR